MPSEIKEHSHNGLDSRQVNLSELFGLLRTITDATELTNVTAQPAKNIYEQIFIDTSTVNKKLYIFDSVGNVWYSVIIT